MKNLLQHLNVKLRNLYDSLSQLKVLRKSNESEDLNIAAALSKELYEMVKYTIKSFKFNCLLILFFNSFSSSMNFMHAQHRHHHKISSWK